MEKRALEPSTVCRCSVRRKHDLDRQREQRPQSLDDLLAGDQPLVQREARSGTTGRVARDERADTAATDDQRS
jgi:hypothetical protein